MLCCTSGDKQGVVRGGFVLPVWFSVSKSEEMRQTSTWVHQQE